MAQGKHEAFHSEKNTPSLFPNSLRLLTIVPFTEAARLNALLTQGLDFEDLFDLAPVSLWMEDYSKFKQVLDQWRADGVTDLLAFVREDPSRLQCFRACFQIVRVNQFTLDLYRAPDQETLISRLDEVLRDDITYNLEDELLALWEGRLRYAKPAINYDLQGRKLHVMVNVRILPGYEHDWSRVMVSLKDETAERESTLQLQQSEQYARELFAQSPVSLWVQDLSQVKMLLDGVRAQGVQDFAGFLQAQPAFLTACIQAIRIVDVNQQTLHMFDAHSLHDMQQHMLHILGAEVRYHMAVQLIDLWEGKLVQKREVVNFSLNSNKLHLHMEFAILQSAADDWSRALVSLVDLSERKKTEAYLQYLSQHDVLTQLYNHAFYLQELERITQNGPWPLSLIAIDMNGLKHTNDTLGHPAGDALLTRMGEVLRQAVKAPAYAARIGGDEFMVLLPGLGMQATQAVKTHILDALAANNQQHPHNPLHVAMGMASCAQGDSIDACVHSADKAMYQEKLRFYQALGNQRTSGSTVGLR
jgi:diguanylate cyclase (GGDEF)-like protein